jgi:hypothetical protein
MTRSTHTYAVLEISSAVYNEIASKLRDAGYDHVFDGAVIDMHGIALQAATDEQDAALRDTESVGADRLARECCRAVDAHLLDARSPIGDALLDYAQRRYPNDINAVSRVRDWSSRGFPPLGPLSPVLAADTSVSRAIDAMQRDTAELLVAVGLMDCARPISCHEVIQTEVLPAIGRLREAQSPLYEVVEGGKYESNAVVRHSQDSDEGCSCENAPFTCPVHALKPQADSAPLSAPQPITPRQRDLMHRAFLDVMRTFSPTWYLQPEYVNRMFDRVFAAVAPVAIHPETANALLKRPLTDDELKMLGHLAQQCEDSADACDTPSLHDFRRLRVLQAKALRGIVERYASPRTEDPKNG